MIARGVFASQLNTVERLLKRADLFDSRQFFPAKSLGASTFRGLNYREVYETVVREFAYNFKLSDQSLLTFDSEGSDIHAGKLSYSFLESPADVISYDKFVASELQVAQDDSEARELIASFGDSLLTEYEQYVVNAESKSVVTPIRYDYSARQYHPGRHPASHMHFGFCNEIRVATRLILNPISFTLFLIRQRYPEYWSRFCERVADQTVFRQIRVALNEVDGSYWCADDDNEMVLQ